MKICFSLDVVAGDEHIVGELKQAEETAWVGRKGRGRGSDRHYICSLTFQQWKSARAAKMEIADFLIIGVCECDGCTVVLLWLSVPVCIHLFHELHLCNFLFTSIICVCVCMLRATMARK